MWRYTSTVHAITQCPSIGPLQVRVLSKRRHGLSWCLAEFILCLSYTVLYRNSGSFKNNGTSFCNLVPNSELSRFFYFFRCRTSFVASVVNWVLLTTITVYQNERPPLFTTLWAWSSVKQFVCDRWDMAFRQDALPDAQPTVSNHWRQWDVDLLVCQHQLQAARCRHCSASCCYLSTAFGREVVCLNQQSTVETAHMRVHIIVHTVVHNMAQKNPDYLLPYPPDSHHWSHAVY